MGEWDRGTQEFWAACVVRPEPFSVGFHKKVVSPFLCSKSDSLISRMFNTFPTALAHALLTGQN